MLGHNDAATDDELQRLIDAEVDVEDVALGHVDRKPVIGIGEVGIKIDNTDSLAAA